MPQAPKIHIEAYIAIAVISIMTALIFKNTISKQTVNTIQRKETIIDIIGASTIALFTFCAVFLTQDPTQINVHSVNATAVHIVISWTLIATLIMIGYRVYKHRPIPI